MRLAWVIVVLAAIGVARVHLDRLTKTAIHETHRLRLLDTPEIRRDIWEQQVRLSYMTAPEQIARRSEQMNLTFVDPTLTPPSDRSVRVAGAPTGTNRAPDPRRR